MLYRAFGKKAFERTEVAFEGAVLRSDGQAPVPGARVVLRDSYGQPLDYGTSDAAGGFRVRLLTATWPPQAAYYELYLLGIPQGFSADGAQAPPPARVVDARTIRYWAGDLSPQASPYNWSTWGASCPSPAGASRSR